MSADPYVSSGGLTNPNSWNRYAYVEGDPINKVDPSGLYAEATCIFDGIEGFCGGGGDGGPTISRDPTMGWCVADTLGFNPFGGPAICYAPALVALGQSTSTPRRPRPKYLLITEDCYVGSSLRRGALAERHVTYQLYGDNDKSFKSATVTEVLSGNLAMKGSRTGQPGGVFEDQHSTLQRGVVQQGTQNFTVSTLFNAMSPDAELTDYPVFVRGFGGDWGTLSIYKTQSRITIQGDDGFDPATGRPRKLCD